MIKRNLNGEQNLTELRRTMANCPQLRDVFSVGGTWYISRVGGKLESCPWNYAERQALQMALFGSIEGKEEARYYKEARSASPGCTATQTHGDE